MAEEIRATFKLKTVQEVLKTEFQAKEKTKISNDALALTSKLIQVFVIEAAMRASSQAELTSEKVVGVEHLEKVLPQLLFDF